MTTNIVSQDLTFGQGSEVVAALVRQGMDSKAAQRLIEDKALAAQVVRMLMDIPAGTTSWSRAAQIMHGRAIDITVAAKLGINVPPAKAIKYASVPFSEAELEQAAASGLYLVAMPATDLLGLRKAAGNRFWDQDWYKSEKFAKTKSRAGYHLLRELPDSTSKNWSEQIAMQPSGFEAPLAVEMAYLSAAWLAMNHGMAFPDWVRTSDVDSDGDRVIAGVGGSQVHVSYDWDSPRNSSVGVASGQFRPLSA